MQNTTNAIVPFEYGSHQIRSIEIENQSYFVAKDVCAVLGLEKAEVTLRKLDDDEKLMRKVYASGQNRDIWLVNESGIYTLIMRSNKPEAKAFRKWVTSEVLPALRKTGSYSAPQHPYREVLRVATLAVAIVGSQNKLAARLGISGGHMSSVFHPEQWHMVSAEMMGRVEQVCNHIVQHGIGYDRKTVDLLMQIKDTKLRTQLYDRFKQGGVL